MSETPKQTVMGGGVGGHHRPIGLTDDWITPLPLIKALGEFDLDPCACLTQPWRTAETMWTKHYDGLLRPWVGRVWLNPPYGRFTIGMWMERMALHNHGTALVFARCETEWFFTSVWPFASAIFFPRGRIRFYRPDGTVGGYTGGAPSCFIAYGKKDADSLKGSGIKGQYLSIKGS